MARDPEKPRLVEAIYEGDEEQISREYYKLKPILFNYLVGVMNASHTDAEDCIHQSLATVLEKVQEAKIQNPDGIKTYIVQCCRRNYFRILERKNRIQNVEEFSEPISPEEQLENLVHSENIELMNRCLEKLSKDNKEFIARVYYEPDKNLSDIAGELDISPNAAWTRKHRIISRLSDCVKKISNSV